MKTLIIANWKMDPQTLKEAKRLFSLVRKGIGKIKNVEVVICPPFVYLSELFDFFCGRKKSQIIIGAQDCFWKEKGAFTGEISPLMLKNLGVKYVIIGHSERRQYLGETDEMVNRKIRAVIKTKLTPILCVGETQEQRDREETEKILRKQIEGALKSVSKFKSNPTRSLVLRAIQQNSKFCIAYEPIWAIGTQNPCDPDEAMTSSLIIKKILTELYNKKVVQGVRILYGGSVNQKNAANYIKEARMDGLLVGGASLKPKEFIGIIKESAGA